MANRRSSHAPTAASQLWLRVLVGACLIQVLLVWLSVWTSFPGFGEAGWPEALLLVLLAASLIVSASTQLPAQNVLLATAIIIIISILVHLLAGGTSIPFGPRVYSDSLGPRLFDWVPWAMPLVWVVAIFSSRGVARLIMRPWRKTRSYGFWVMGLTILLVLLFDLGLEPYATQVRHYWTWNPTHALLFWYRTPWVNFVGWAATTGLILAFATPSLINKRPAKHATNFYPPAIWLLANVLFLTAALVQHLWMGAAVEVTGMIIAVILALRGATW